MATRRISTTEAAADKGCSRQTINEAIRGGKINAEKIGKWNAVLTDKKYRDWAPNPSMQKGGKARAKKAKQAKK